MKRITSVVLGCAALVWLGGCSGSGDSVGQVEAQTPEGLLANAMEAFREDRPTVGTYRSAVQQLDTYLDLKKDVAGQLALGKPERDLIEGQLLRGLVRRGRPEDATTLESRLKDLERKSFTSADAYHLDACFLFRDAAVALKQYYVGEQPLANDPALPAYKLELARQAFNWVMRQVQLQPQPAGLDTWPAHEILRRGTGDADERARIFLALLEQLELDGCMLTRTIEIENERKVREPRELPWIPAVLIDKDLYLFEARLGRPIPAADGQGVATLREVLLNSELLKNLYAGDADPVTLAQLAKPAVLIPSTLPALAPRMRLLQTWLLDANNKAIVFEDLPAVMKRFRGAKLDAEVRLWTSAAGSPAVILHRYVENPRAEPRLQEAIVPRKSLIPAWVHQLDQQLGQPFSQFLYRTFDNAFLSIRVQPVSIQEVDVKEEGQPSMPGINQTKRIQRRTGGVRDLLVRGRPEQSADRILDMETKIGKMQEVFRAQVDPTGFRVEKELRDVWAPKLIATKQRLDELLVQQQSQGDKAGLGASEQARLLIQSLEGMIREQEVLLAYLSINWAAPEIQEHLTYFMGLAKIELAIRSEQQALRGQQGATTGLLTPAQQWASAADWFERYQALVLPQPRNYWGKAVARHLAACREAEARLAAKK